MYQRRRARVLLAVLVLVSLILVTIDFRSEDGPLDDLRRLATRVFGPVQDGVSSAVRPVGDAFSSVGDLFRLREENARLQERLDELSQRSRSFTDLERENEQLRALLDMRDSRDFDTVVARAVALAPSNYEWTITLDVGSDDGVARDMPVVNGDGLVGRVIQVTRSASRVLLAIDPNFSASARTASSQEVGSIDGRGGDLMLFRPLDPEAGINVGDEVVTNQYEYGIFPAGIPIGTVDRVGEATTLLSRVVDVRPFVDFTRLDLVMVVLQAPVTPPAPVPDRPTDAPRIPDDLRPSPTPPPLVSPSPSPAGEQEP